MRADGSHARSLGVQGDSPAWSPDGTWIAYVRRGGISTVRPDGTGVRALAESGGTPTSVDWSPDGQSLVFAERRHLYVVGADGAGLRQLTRGVANDAAPSWQAAG
jgi:Tol biopolymer transport system component